MTDMTDMTQFTKSWWGKEHTFSQMRPIGNLCQVRHVRHVRHEELAEISHLFA
jgi:hypothetical protein